MKRYLKLKTVGEAKRDETMIQSVKARRFRLRGCWRLWRSGILPMLGVLVPCAELTVLAQAQILVNQLGYRPGDPKIAFIKELRSGQFGIVDVSTNEIAYSGRIRSVGKADRNTGDMVLELDFTEFRSPGAYRIIVPWISDVSPVFHIDESVYHPAVRKALESYYYQRCGMEVNDGTPWKHPPCHVNDAVFFDKSSNRKDVVGGWHDAGDYGKFVATAAVSAAFLLYLYEHKPEDFTDQQLGIPEEGNGSPDLLDEVRWELTWLLKMQRDDGAVYHKVSSKKWTGEYLPHRDPDTRYIFSVSSAATAVFAAVTALSARQYRIWDQQFAHKLLKASMRAWEYLEQHPEIVPSGGFRNPAGVEGGEYGDTQDEDERLWAAVELYRTTGKTAYHRYFLDRYRALGGIHYPVSWQRVQNFAYYSYVRIRPSQTDPYARSYTTSTLRRYCDALIQRINENGYRYVLKPEEHYWGSNSVAMGYAFDLIQAFDLLMEERYLHAALDQLHFILGRNTFGKSFLTGIGSNPVRRPYHQFSMMLRADKPVPGLMVGGPNRNSRMRGTVHSEYPGKCYEDIEKNYFVNEVAINYTAPFLYVAGYLTGMRTDRPQEPSVDRGQ